MFPALLTLRPASVSRDLNSAASIPRLAHSLHDPNSVLSLSADADHIFTGSQCFSISVRVSCTLSTPSAHSNQESSLGMEQEVLHVQNKPGRSHR